MLAMKSVGIPQAEAAELGEVLESLTGAPPYEVVCELTWTCPLACTYCHNAPRFTAPGLIQSGLVKRLPQLSPKSTELSTGGWIDVLGQACSLGVGRISLTGGEPLVRRDLEDLIRYLSSNGTPSYLITTGEGLTPERAGALANAGLTGVQITLSAHRHLSASDFDKNVAARLRAMSMFRDCSVPVDCNVVCIRQLVDRIPGLTVAAFQAGAREVRLSGVRRYGHAFHNWTSLVPSKEQLASMWREIGPLRAEYKSRIFIDDQVDPVKRESSIYNWWGFWALMVAADGNMYPDEGGPHLGAQALLGNVADTPLRDAWHSPFLEGMRELTWLREPCTSCEIRSVCRGGSRYLAAMLRKDIFAPDPTCPKVMASSNSLIRIASTVSAHSARRSQKEG